MGVRPLLRGYKKGWRASVDTGKGESWKRLIKVRRRIFIEKSEVYIIIERRGCVEVMGTEGLGRAWRPGGGGEGWEAHAREFPGMRATQLRHCAAHAQARAAPRLCPPPKFPRWVRRGASQLLGGTSGEGVSKGS